MIKRLYMGYGHPSHHGNVWSLSDLSADSTFDQWHTEKSALVDWQWVFPCTNEINLQTVTTGASKDWLINCRRLLSKSWENWESWRALLCPRDANIWKPCRAPNFAQTSWFAQTLTLGMPSCMIRRDCRKYYITQLFSDWGFRCGFLGPLVLGLREFVRLLRNTKRLSQPRYLSMSKDSGLNTIVTFGASCRGQTPMERSSHPKCAQAQRCVHWTPRSHGRSDCCGNPRLWTKARISGKLI